MNVEDYVKVLASDETKTSGIEFILVFKTENGELDYNIGNDFNVLIDSYEEDDLTPEKALKIALTKQDSKFGAIYKRKGNQFELLVKEGLENVKKS